MSTSLRLDLKPHALRGKMIIFCGADGSGKSTLIDFAFRYVTGLGKTAVNVELLDDLIKQSRAFREFARDPLAAEDVDLLALSLVCAGNRLQNVRTLVLDELAAGSWVFCDRYIFTTWAEFLALTSDVTDREVLRAVLQLFPKPDAGFLPYADVDVCLGRVRKREEEATMVLGRDRYTNLIRTYRAVAAENDLVQICTEESQSECERVIAAHLERIN